MGLLVIGYVWLLLFGFEHHRLPRRANSSSTSADATPLAKAVSLIAPFARAVWRYLRGLPL